MSAPIRTIVGEIDDPILRFRAQPGIVPGDPGIVIVKIIAGDPAHGDDLEATIILSANSAKRAAAILAKCAAICGAT